MGPKRASEEEEGEGGESPSSGSLSLLSLTPWTSAEHFAGSDIRCTRLSRMHQVWMDGSRNADSSSGLGRDGGAPTGIPIALDECAVLT